MSHRKWVIAAILTTLLLGGALGIWLCRGAMEAVRDAYAGEAVASLVVEHLSHSGSWPRSWEDLGGAYNRAAAKSRWAWEFEELRRRVEIDFTADLSELARATEVSGVPPFRVITLKSGRDSHWENWEPNLVVLRYLHKSGWPAPTDGGKK